MTDTDSDDWEMPLYVSPLEEVWTRIKKPRHENQRVVLQNGETLLEVDFHYQCVFRLEIEGEKWEVAALYRSEKGNSTGRDVFCVRPYDPTQVGRWNEVEAKFFKMSKPQGTPIYAWGANDAKKRFPELFEVSESTQERIFRQVAMETGLTYEILALGSYPRSWVRADTEEEFVEKTRALAQERIDFMKTAPSISEYRTFVHTQYWIVVYRHNPGSEGYSNSKCYSRPEVEVEEIIQWFRENRNLPNMEVPRATEEAYVGDMFGDE